MRVDGLRIRAFTDYREIRLYYSAEDGDKPNKRQLIKHIISLLEDTLRELQSGKLIPGGQGAGRVAGYADLLVEEGEDG